MMLKKALGGLAALSLTVLGLSACVSITDENVCSFSTPQAPQEEVKGGVVLIFQASKDFPDAETPIRQNYELLSFLPVDNESAPVQFGAVVADGDPAAIFQNWIQARSLSTDGDIQRQSEDALPVLANIYRCTFAAGSSAKALQENVNIVGALDQAARLLANVAGKREIHVFSNGFQTSGQPNFSQIFPANRDEARKIIDALEKSSALPDLDGAQVRWTGLGQTSPAVEPISQQAKNVLEYFWATLIERSGGLPPEEFASAVFLADAPEGALSSSPLAEFAELCLFTLGESSGFAFSPGSADFVNTELAEIGAVAIAREVVESGCGGVRLSVTGYTASGKSRSSFEAEGPNMELSAARAAAFAELLTELGLQVVESIGGGKGPIDDWDEAGNFVEELGKQNRIVRIQEVQ
ncbi:hypothetical protein N9F59_00075 [Aquiluna sp.]|nr:hypothetical protein [Aquiluna sp.]MDA8992681.1 hypothetical protein [Aquiluna sp.]